MTLPVEIRAPSPAGALEPELDDDTLVLEGTHPPGATFPRGVDVDALVILDLDAQGVVGVAELLIPRELWEEERELPRFAAGAPGCIAVAATDLSWLDGSHVRARFDAARARLLLQLAPLPVAPTVVRLSPRCDALVQDGCLVAFDVRLGGDHDGPVDGLDRDALVGLVRRIMAGEGESEHDHDALLAQFERNVPHPDASGLIFWPKHGEPTPEEVVDEALAYRPIVPPPPQAG